MIMKAGKYQERLQNALDSLELTEHNRQLADRYLDLSEPEDPKLLEDAETQDFCRLDKSVRRGVYYSFLVDTKKEKEELAGRFIRLVVRIGGATARQMISGNGYQVDFEYAGKFLTPVETAVLQADSVAWSESLWYDRGIRFLVEMGRQDPESLVRMWELCYDENAVNTKMFLTAVYLYCVRPLDDAKSVLCIPADETDPRAEGDPSRVREMTDYLEQRLMGNIDGMFQDKDKPEGEMLERLKTFVRESEPGEPMPVEVRAVLSGRDRRYYLVTFLNYLAFLAVEHSNRFVSMLRLSMALDEENIPNKVLNTCQRTDRKWFERHIKALEEFLTISEEAYIQWAVLGDGRESRVLVRMSKKAPDAMLRVLPKIPAKYYGYLAGRIREGNPEVYQEVEEQVTEQYQRCMAHDITEKFKTAQDAAKRYLLEELEIEDILPYVKDWRNMSFYDYDRESRIYSCLESGLKTLHRRALILECLRKYDSYFRRYWLCPKPDDGKSENGYRMLIDPRQIRAILELLEEERVPAQYQLDFLGSEYANFYDYNGQGVYKSDDAMQRCVEVLAARHADWKAEYMEAAKGSLADTRILAIRVMAELGEEYKEALLSCSSDSAKQVQALLQAIYTEHPDWEADMLAMLKAKKASVREMAVKVLKNWGIEQYREPLTQALNAEKTKKVKDLIQGLLSSDSQKPQEQTLDGVVADLLFGGRKRKLSWFLEKRQTKVHKQDGSEASEDHVAAILIAYADMNIPGIHADAGKLAEELKPEELAACVRELYHLWIGEGAPAKKKWVLYAAAIHGGDAMVPVLYAQIQEWAKGTRGAMAAEAVRALALNGSSTALLQVDQIARKFRFRQVKAAAAAALSFAAEQLGITREELEDRIVPDLGFDERMEQVFDYGRRKFRVILTPALTLEVYDEKGKKLKNLPAPGKQDDPETATAASDAWKLLKKQLKTVITNQTLRLEQALGLSRRWTAVQWQELFVKNPVMHQFAAGLIWGVYEKEALQATFRYMEDGSFNTADEEEYELPKEAVIGLVHPVELSADLLSAWKEQLEDYEIVQPVLQLDRPVYAVAEEEKEMTELTRFKGLEINGLTLAGRLLNMGWYRGEILDGGSYFNFGRMDRKIAVKLEFSGCCVGGENEDVTVYGVSFHKPGEAKRVGNTYETERYRLEEIPPEYFSETVLQITKATAAAVR